MGYVLSSAREAGSPVELLSIGRTRPPCLLAVKKVDHFILENMAYRLLNIGKNPKAGWACQYILVKYPHVGPPVDSRQVMYMIDVHHEQTDLKVCFLVTHLNSCLPVPHPPYLEEQNYSHVS